MKIYPHHPDGVATIKFKAPDAAAKCVGLMEGRFFGGRQVEANLWDGITKCAPSMRRLSSCSSLLAWAGVEVQLLQTLSAAAR